MILGKVRSNQPRLFVKILNAGNFQSRLVGLKRKKQDKVLENNALFVEEIQSAERQVKKLTQSKFLGAELKTLIQAKKLSKSSSLLKLNPFIDGDGLRRRKTQEQ